MKWKDYLKELFGMYFEFAKMAFALAALIDSFLNIIIGSVIK